MPSFFRTGMARKQELGPAPRVAPATVQNHSYNCPSNRAYRGRASARARASTTPPRQYLGHGQPRPISVTRSRPLLVSALSPPLGDETEKHLRLVRATSVLMGARWGLLAKAEQGKERQKSLSHGKQMLNNATSLGEAVVQRASRFALAQTEGKSFFPAQSAARCA